MLPAPGYCASATFLQAGGEITPPQLLVIGENSDAEGFTETILSPSLPISVANIRDMYEWIRLDRRSKNSRICNVP
jgi:hypothetical protein